MNCSLLLISRDTLTYSRVAPLSRQSIYPPKYSNGNVERTSRRFTSGILKSSGVSKKSGKDTDLDEPTVKHTLGEVDNFITHLGEDNVVMWFICGSFVCCYININIYFNTLFNLHEMAITSITL